MWPLLGLLASGANEPGRGELAQALGFDADRAADAAREVLGVASSSAAVTLAIGLWTRSGLPIHQAWLDLLPPGSAGSLDADSAVGQETLDAWARDQTDGLIEHMPMTLTGDDLVVLASALLVRTRWIEPFETTMLTGGPHGPWQNRRFDGLYRTSTDLDQVEVAHGPAGTVTTVRVRGSGEIDVILVLGEPDGAPGTILAQGIAVATGTYEPTAAGYREMAGWAPG